GGLNAGKGVFDHNALIRWQIQCLCGLKIDLRVWFALVHQGFIQNNLEIVPDPRPVQGEIHICAWRRRGNGAGNVRPVKLIEEFNESRNGLNVRGVDFTKQRLLFVSVPLGQGRVNTTEQVRDPVLVGPSVNLFTEFGLRQRVAVLPAEFTQGDLVVWIAVYDDTIHVENK